MKMVFVWFFLSCKRYLKKPGILLALLLLPVTAWIAGKYVHPENEGIKIALYLQETAGENVDLSENGGKKRIREKMIQNKTGKIWEYSW